MNTIDCDILRINKKAVKNSIKLNPILPKESICMHKQSNGIVLPEELVRFYTEIGNGCKMIDGFDLMKFEELEFDIKKVKKDFPFDNYWIWEDKPNDSLINEVRNGNVELIDIGDCQSWNIIITGKEKGQMWFFTDVGIQPCVPRRNFLSWFEYWLDGKEDYFKDFGI